MHMAWILQVLLPILCKLRGRRCYTGVADTRMWDSQFDEFSTTHSVVGCDLRGFGRSGMPSAQFANYEDLAALC